MKTLALTATLTILATAQPVYADTLSDQIYKYLTENGYSDIEIREADGTLIVEAEGMNGQDLTVVYDASTGTIIEQSVDEDGVQEDGDQEDHDQGEQSDDNDDTDKMDADNEENDDGDDKNDGDDDD